MADLEQIRRRLANIRTVQPVLGALRTISLGSWQAAMRQRVNLRSYEEGLQSVLGVLSPHLSDRVPADYRRWRRSSKVDVPQESRHLVLLGIGSERGLCGRFNQVVADGVVSQLEQQRRRVQRVAGADVHVMVLGSRLSRILNRRGIAIAWQSPLSSSALPSFYLAQTLVGEWLTRYEAHDLDGVSVVCNAYCGPGCFETVTRLLLPLDGGWATEAKGAGYGGAGYSDWVGDERAIVETDSLSLWARIIEQLLSIRFYGFLLESATAEHAIRYQLMESATQNARRLLEELTAETQALRRQAITREMQELAVGAGLLKS